MCDYSLMNLPNRLAKEGEILVTHKFSNGPIGFVSSEELCNAQPLPQVGLSGSWIQAGAGLFGLPAHSGLPAVCVPPGARLKVLSISDAVRGMVGAAPGEEVVFTQITALRNRFRDALRIRGKYEVLLQSIGEGLQIQVVSLALASEPQPTRRGMHPQPRPTLLSAPGRFGSAARRADRGLPHWSTFIGTW
jgi:hypothetical protein